ncbi:MAG: ABC transporter permease subunit [Gammaproteobacteria bacterium]
MVAAVAAAVPQHRIIFRHMVPYAMAPVLISATIDVAGAILTESALSFLGFGVQPTFATWGNILADRKRLIFRRPLAGIADLGRDPSDLGLRIGKRLCSCRAHSEES